MRDSEREQQLVATARTTTSSASPTRKRLGVGIAGILLYCIVLLALRNLRYFASTVKSWSSVNSIADSLMSGLTPLTVDYSQQQHQSSGSEWTKSTSTITVNGTQLLTSDDPRLPKRPTKPATKPTDRVLVVYSGPTQVVNRTIVEHPSSNKFERKAELYRVNFEHFLKYGVQCKTQDTVLVVTKEVEVQYRARVDRMHAECQSKYKHQVILAIRNSTCLDLETVRRVFHDDIVDIDSYDYFVYANCGTSGPARKWANLPWTDVFIDKLSDTVKMSGLTVNCRGPPHVQSMVYALDRVAIAIMKKSRAIFDCVKEPPNLGIKEANQIINRYERGMSREIMNAGYGVASIIKPIVLNTKSVSACRANDDYRDQWMTNQMNTDYGRLLDLEDTVFFKTSRIMSEATKKELNFTLEVNWSW